MPLAKDSPQLAMLFATLVEQASGVAYGPRDHALFARKLEDHALEQGYESLLDYYYHLRYADPEGVELQRLLDVLVVHETYFFRELPPLVELIDHHLAAICRERGRSRVWSAACATGEEPYTLAMLLDDRGLLDRVEIVASDLSATVLARAASGIHGRRSLRDGYPARLAARYLEITPDRVTVVPRIRSAVELARVNLLDADAVARLGTFDAILCRNVLIYFRDERIASVVERLAGALAPGGLLLVGVSESLLRFGTSLVFEERGGSFFYRKAA